MRQETLDSWKHSRPSSAEKQELKVVLVLGGLALVLMLASIWLSFG